MADRTPAAEEMDDGGFDFAISEDLVRSPTHRAPAAGTLDFDGLLQPALQLHQDLANGNGGQAWPAGVVLAKYLLRRKRDALRGASMSVRPQLAVALGCRPSRMVHITDQAPMLALMRQNIALNLLEDGVAASVLDWGSSSSQLHPVPGVPGSPSTSHAASGRGSSGHPDVLLAADCVYFEPAFPLLQQTLRDFIGPNTTCYFCFKKRRRADWHFIAKVKRQFVVEKIMDDSDSDAYARENIFLYTIRKKPEQR